MMFFCKPSRIVLDAFTSVAGVYDLFPVQSASKFFPEWYKKLTPTHEVNTGVDAIPVTRSTIKKCQGLVNLYQKGFIIPMWSDLNVKVHADGKFYWIYSSPEADGMEWATNEIMGPEFCDSVNIKLLSPWRFQEKTGVDFYFAEPFWNRIKSMDYVHIPPGITNYRDQAATHINIFVPKSERVIKFNCNDPVAHIIPLSEKDIEIRTHLVSAQEYQKFGNRMSYSCAFSNKYNVMNKLRRNSPPVDFFAKKETKIERP